MSSAEPAKPPPQSATYDFAPDLIWPDDIGANAEAVNQVIVAWDQNSQDVLYLYLGHVGPPPWLSPEIAAERLEANNGRLPVVKKGSFVLSRYRAEEMYRVLGRHLGKEETP